MLYFTFFAGKDLFAIDTSYIEIIVPSLYVKPLARVSKNVRGVLEFRDELVTVIDFCELMTGNSCPAKMHARIAVLQNGVKGTGKKMLGVLGEFATDILESESLLKPDTSPHLYIQQAVKIGDSLVQIIDVPRFFKAFQNLKLEF